MASQSDTVLRPVEFEILLTLAGGERHGYGIIQDAETRTGGRVRLGTGTLYRALKRLVEAGLVDPAEVLPVPGGADDRRRHYRITPRGRAVTAAEAARLATLVDAARAAGFIPERT